jgi:histidine triad (HIT) family protein
MTEQQAAAACPFCDLIERRDRKIMRTEHPEVYCLEPLGPVTEGHLLFLPKIHVIDAGYSPSITGLVFTEAARWADRQKMPFNLITSAGPAATQTVNHLHVHFVPRRADDNLALPWTGQHKRTVEHTSTVKPLGYRLVQDEKDPAYTKVYGVGPEEDRLLARVPTDPMVFPGRDD